jgi:predicted Mrr-cat superfamily restriction endonuclease
MQAFVCRVKPDGKNDITHQALRESTLFYGLADIPGLLDSSHTLESIRSAIADVHPEYGPLREAKMFWMFSRTIRIGDLVLVPKKLPKERYVSYYLAEAVSEAYADLQHADTNTIYRRQVRWLNNRTTLRREELPVDLIEKINQPYNVRRTCLDISEFAGAINQLAIA